jgi:hypothetical protein
VCDGDTTINYINYVSQKKLLGRIFGDKRKEAAAGWKKLRNEELYNLYASPNVIWAIKSRRMKRVGHVARMGEMISSNKFLVGKTERKRPF